MDNGLLCAGVAQVHGIGGGRVRLAGCYISQASPGGGHRLRHCTRMHACTQRAPFALRPALCGMCTCAVWCSRWVPPEW